VTNNITLTANFNEITTTTYQVRYIAGTGGTLTDGKGYYNDTLVYDVPAGHDVPTDITAVADKDYVFKQWSDGDSKANRLDTNINSNLSFTALFIAEPTCSGGLVYGRITYNLIENSARQCWLDKNLEANSACNSAADTDCYGALYQWGRLRDGHQYRISDTTGELSPKDNPGHSMFISATKVPFDWRSPKNNDLWNVPTGQSTIVNNNPCPEGFRVPTAAELQTETQNWKYPDARGAIESPLKWPLAGERSFGIVVSEGTTGNVWSADDDGGDQSYSLVFSNSLVGVGQGDRAIGKSVRCIRH
jgi:uncharacterized protein (TIGR02145 family)